MRSIVESVAPVTVLYNLVAFVFVIIVVANGEQRDDLIIFGRNDAWLLIVLAIVGLGLNLVSGILRLRTFVHTSREIDRGRPRISGE